MSVLQEKPTLRVRIGSQVWLKIGQALERSLGAFSDYNLIREWFRSQKAQFEPESDRALHYYSLVFENHEDLTEFVLKWL